jgi:N-acetylneuraminic acid mutarotase
MGGFPGGCCSGLPTAEVYDPVQKTWRSVGAMTYGRFGFTATTLVDGKVLAAGGYSCCTDPIRPFTEIYNLATQTWTSAGNMGTPRYNHAAVLLKDGSILVSGGITNANNEATATAEVFGETSTPLGLSVNISVILDQASDSPKPAQ